MMKIVWPKPFRVQLGLKLSGLSCWFKGGGVWINTNMPDLLKEHLGEDLDGKTETVGDLWSVKAMIPQVCMIIYLPEV